MLLGIFRLRLGTLRETNKLLQQIYKIRIMERTRSSGFRRIFTVAIDRLF